MDQNQFKEQWKKEESAAHIHGWDFSHIHGRYEEENDLPWNYEAVVRKHLTPEQKLLDLDTGGGEFLLSLKHPYDGTSATEGYAPNVDLCKHVLLPLGVDFREAKNAARLPFANDTFDIVINRHGDFDARELFRILKPGGVFITEQVGAENDRELVNLLLPGTKLPFPEQVLSIAVRKFKKQSFKVLEAREAFRPIEFYDVGALVWFARIIEWEFPGFSVESCFPRLCAAQRILEKVGKIQGRIHRFLLVAQRPCGKLPGAQRHSAHTIAR